jgi:hypothetical protein
MQLTGRVSHVFEARYGGMVSPATIPNMQN